MQILKFLSIFFLIFLFLIISTLVVLIVPWRWRQTKIKTFFMQRFCQLGLMVLGIKVTSKNKGQDLSQNHLIVCNHLSYVDILILSAQFPTCFVTSVEIRETLGLGFITRMANCLYVERRSKANLQAEVGELAEALQNDVNVTIFPEATSTNGEQVLRFRRPLYRAAIESRRPILPLCLNYLSIDNRPLHRENRDQIFWYGDMDFVSHLWALTKAKSIVASLDFMPIQNPSPTSSEANLAENSHGLVSAAFRPVL